MKNISKKSNHMVTKMKTFTIETDTVEYLITAMDLQDALDTFDGNPNEIVCIKEPFDEA